MAESTHSPEPSKDDKPFVPEGEPKPARAGSVAIPYDKWYNLKLSYVDRHGNVQGGYAYYLGVNPTWSFWDYMSTSQSNGPVGRFQKVPIPGKGNRVQLKTDDGYWLSCRAAPRLWLYRSSAYPVGWEIVDGKLYTDYHDGPVGAVFHHVLVPEAYYLCVAAEPTVFNCEWVLSPQQ